MEKVPVMVSNISYTFFYFITVSLQRYFISVYLTMDNALLTALVIWGSKSFFRAAFKQKKNTQSSRKWILICIEERNYSEEIPFTCLSKSLKPNDQNVSHDGHTDWKVQKRCFKISRSYKELYSNDQKQSKRAINNALQLFSGLLKEIIAQNILIIFTLK